jgi:hypothetical protein
MNRRDFSKTAGLVAAAAVVAPKILAEGSPKWIIEQGDFDADWNEATPEQRLAIQRMQDNMPSPEIFKKVAGEFPPRVPIFTSNQGAIKKSFQHGNFRILGAIGGLPPSAYEDGYIYLDEVRKDTKQTDLSDISYTGMYRQAVRNKYTNKPALFVATIPLEVAQEVNPGQCIDINKSIQIGTSDVEIERMAQESFVKLQELVVEYYNREE